MSLIGTRNPLYVAWQSDGGGNSVTEARLCHSCAGKVYNKSHYTEGNSYYEGP